MKENNYVVVFYDNEGYSHCGTEGTWMFDLKTVKGVIRRIESKGYCIPKWSTLYAIFSYSTWWNRTTDKLSSCESYALAIREVNR